MGHIFEDGVCSLGLPRRDMLASHKLLSTCAPTHNSFRFIHIHRKKSGWGENQRAQNIYAAPKAICIWAVVFVIQPTRSIWVWMLNLATQPPTAYTVALFSLYPVSRSMQPASQDQKPNQHCLRHILGGCSSVLCSYAFAADKTRPIPFRSVPLSFLLNRLSTHIFRNSKTQEETERSYHPPLCCLLS